MSLTGVEHDHSVKAAPLSLKYPLGIHQRTRIMLNVRNYMCLKAIHGTNAVWCLSRCSILV